MVATKKHESKTSKNFPPGQGERSSAVAERRDLICLPAD
jgi:hypothetical protein